MAKLNEWDSFNRNVQSGLTEGQFLAAQYTLIAAGPPNLAFLTADGATASADELEPSGGALVFPIGISQQFGLAETRQHARVFEIGSERSYWISGRSVGQISLGRMIYHGPNLLRALFAYYKEDKGNHQFESLLGDSEYVREANDNRNPHVIQISPGYKNIFMNLASDLFGQTTGLMIYLKDSNNEAVYAGYAENCVIPSYSLGMDAGGTVLQESVQIQFERFVPVEISTPMALTDINSSYRVSRPGYSEQRYTGRNY